MGPPRKFNNPAGNMCVSQKPNKTEREQPIKELQWNDFWVFPQGLTI